MLKDLIKTSIFVLLSREILKGCCFIRAWFGKIYKDSYLLYRWPQVFFKAIKVCFRYSFLGRFTEVEGNRYVVISENSKTFKCVRGIYKTFQERLISYSKISAAVGLGGGIKKELCSSPIRICGIIVVVAILTNIFFSLLFNKEMDLVAWGLFLFLGVGGLFCNSDWQDLKKTSFLLGLIHKERQ